MFSATPDRPLGQRTFDFVSSVAKMAKKYVMVRLLDSMIEKVTMDWPDTLDKWDLIQAQISGARDYLIKRRTEDDMAGPYPNEFIAEPAAVIQFAHEYAQPDMLPAAFYRLSCLDHLYDTFPEPEAEGYDVPGSGEPNFRSSCLQAEDYKALHLGETDIKAWVRGMAYQHYWLPRFDGNCRGGEQYRWTCKSSTWWEEKIKPEFLRLLIWDTGDVLWLIQGFIRELPEGLCPTCKAHARSCLQKSRDMFWEMLPNFFRLDPWTGTSDKSMI